MAFFGKPKDDHAFEHAHESPPVMTGPLLILAIGALGAGVVFADTFIEHGYAGFWRGSLSGSAVLLAGERGETRLLKWLPTIMMAGGFLVAYLAYIRETWLPAWTVQNFKPIHAFLYN